MNEADERRRKAPASAAGQAVGGRCRPVLPPLADRLRRALGGGGKPVAYSILFQ